MPIKRESIRNLILKLADTPDGFRTSDAKESYKYAGCLAREMVQDGIIVATRESPAAPIVYRRGHVPIQKFQKWKDNSGKQLRDIVLAKDKVQAKPKSKGTPLPAGTKITYCGSANYEPLNPARDFSMAPTTRAMRCNADQVPA